MGACPKCAAEIEIDECAFDDLVPRVGMSLTCPGCGASLEVVGLSPLVLDLGRGEDDH